MGDGAADAGDSEDELDLPPSCEPHASPYPKPQYLRASDPESWQKPEDATWGDWSLNPERPLTARHREVARLMFLGKPQSEICEAVGYTAAWVSRLSTNSKVLAEVERLRDLAFQKTVGERLKDIGPASMDVIEELILEGKGVKAIERAHLAQWVVEKLDGKAGQKIDVASSTLDKFMTLLREVQESGKPIDVTPQLSAGPVGPSLEPTAEAAPAAPAERDWTDWFAETPPR